MKTGKKNRIVFTEKVCLLSLLFLLSASSLELFSVYAAPDSASQTGSFDIAKVRAAVAGTSGLTGAKKEIPKTPSIVAVVVRMVISLAIILLLLAIAVYVFRRLTFKGRSMGHKSGIMDVLETMNIMPGKTLALVRVQDRVLLLGIYQDGMETLTQFESEKAVEIIKATDRGNTPNLLAHFGENLSAFTEKLKGRREIKNSQPNFKIE
jgi:flagellar biogenesis protein FliO